MHIDNERIEQLAAIVATLPASASGLDFHSRRVDGRDVPDEDMYPALGHPASVEFFFFVCLHQHGFWHGGREGYLQPLVGYMDGAACKGSDLLWKVCKRALDADPRAFEPKRLANMSREGLARIFTDDRGPIPFDDMKARLTLTREYGRRLCENVQTPAGLVEAANASRTGRVLADFLAMLVGTSGMGEHESAKPGVYGFGDPFRKKAMLLAMALANRPEKFLRAADPEAWRPIVDYHVMRVALRSGLVVIDGPAAERNARRRWIDKETERRIRELTYLAVDRVMRRSMRSLAVVDHAFWSARRFCPEMEPPKCDGCAFASVCAKKTEFFQPVYRTTDY